MARADLDRAAAGRVEHLGAEPIKFPVDRVMKRIRRRMADQPVVIDDACPPFRQPQNLDLPRIWDVLRHAAHDAWRREVDVVMIRQGFHVRKGQHSEIIRWEQADIGMLSSAIDRVDDKDRRSSGRGDDERE